jgi:hypothetical protein
MDYEWRLLSEEEPVSRKSYLVLDVFDSKEYDVGIRNWFFKRDKVVCTKEDTIEIIQEDGFYFNETSIKKDENVRYWCELPELPIELE